MVTFIATGMNDMFTIDFLKRQGLPVRSQPLKIAVFTSIATVSLIVFCLLGMQYFNNKTVLRSKQIELASCRAMQDKKSGAGSEKSRIEAKMAIYDQCRFEVASSIGRYVQWTPVLAEFAGSLPPSLLLNELSVVRTIEKKKVTSIRDQKKKVDYEIISRTLKSDVYDFMPAVEGTAVENYLGDLRKSQPLKGVLTKAYIVESSDAEYIDNNNNNKKPVKNYIINCLLKSQEIADSK